jgi:predicted Zn finger-like uncharacterized protein
VAAKEDQQVVVICPRCKTKLKVNEARLSPEGTRFKCPKCGAVLVVKKPVAAPVKKALSENKILVALSNPEISRRIAALLSENGFSVLSAADGIDAMVRALKELPSLGIVEVALPKIYGFEVCRRLKSREETKDMKFVLVPSIHDKAKYRREPVSYYGADEYIEEHDIDSQLMDKINRLLGREEGETEETGQARVKATEPAQQGPATEPVVKHTAPAVDLAPADERIERAKRLARTIINDIYLYNAARVDEALRIDNFFAAFASEIREGQKLYDSRIPQEVRDKDNFYKEAIDRVSC